MRQLVVASWSKGVDGAPVAIRGEALTSDGPGLQLSVVLTARAATGPSGMLESGPPLRAGSQRTRHTPEREPFTGSIPAIASTNMRRAGQR
jgi:hypothetical protein